MKHFFNRVFGKAAPQPVVTQNVIMTEVPRRESPDRDFDGLAKDGYQKNVAASRCVNLVSDAVATLPFALYQTQANGEKVRIMNHPLLDLLKRPNPMQGKQEFFKEAIGNLMIGGNSYMNAIRPFDTKPPRELFNFRPGQVEIVSGQGVMPLSYNYKLTNGSVIKFGVDQLTGESLVLQTKLYNPRNQWYGQSPLESAASEVDQFNEMNVWNFSLLRNGARPSVAIISGNQGGSSIQLTQQQRDLLREDIDTLFSGGRNAGRPLLLEGGTDIKEMQLSPKEMDFLKNKSVTTKDIGNAYGVPGQMLGVEGSQTFANYAQARQSFYIETVIPVAGLLFTDLNYWLVPMYGDNLILEVDENNVAALEPMRQAKWDKVQSADWLTLNEKRDATGLGKYISTGDPADTIFVSGNMFPLEFVADVSQNDDNKKENVLKTPPTTIKDENGGFTYLHGKQFNLTTEKQKRIVWFEFNRKKITFESRFAAQMSGFFARQSKDIENALVDVNPQLIQFVVESILDDGIEDMNNIFGKNNGAAYRSFGQDVLDFQKHCPDEVETKQETVEDEFLREVLRYADTYALTNVKGINGTTRKKLTEIIKNGLADGESTPVITKNITEAYSKFGKTRARTIARTEVQSSSNGGSRAAAKKLNIQGLEKEWISALDERTRDGSPESTNHKDMNGVKTLMDNDFEVWSADGNDFMEGPGDVKAPVDQLVNCRCTQVYVSRRKQ